MCESVGSAVSALRADVDSDWATVGRGRNVRPLLGVRRGSALLDTLYTGQ